MSIYACGSHTWSNTKKLLLRFSLPSATLRHPMRCTEALPPVKVRVDGRSQWRQHEANVWWQRPRYSWSIQSRWTNLYSYTSDLGIFSVRRVPVSYGAYIECNSYRMPKTGAIAGPEVHGESARCIELHRPSPFDASTRNSKKKPVNDNGIINNARNRPIAKSVKQTIQSSIIIAQGTPKH